MPRDTTPDAVADPHDLALVRMHLSWTPAQRLEHLRQAAAFVARVRKGRWLPPEPANDSSDER